MNTKNITTFSELSNKINVMQEQSKATHESIVTLEHTLKDLAEIIKYGQQYKENQPYNLKYEKAKNKDSVYRKYESQIILFGGAERMLKCEKFNPKAVNLAQLKSEYQKLQQQKNDLGSSFKDCHKEL